MLQQLPGIHNLDIDFKAISFSFPQPPIPEHEESPPVVHQQHQQLQQPDLIEALDSTKTQLSQSKSLSTSDHDLQSKSPTPRGVKYSQSLRVKREGGGSSSKADRSGWSLGNMAKALGSGVVQGTKAVSSGVVQGTKAVGSGVVQGTKVVGSGVVQGSIVVGSGVVQGSKAVGTGVVQGTKAAGRMTKDVTIAVGKGVYQVGEEVVNGAVTGVSAPGEATVSAGRVVTNVSVSAVNETTKWVKEQSESFGGDDHESYTVLPGDTLDSIALLHGVTVYDLIRLNTLHRRALIPGTQLLIPEESDQITPHPDEIFVAKAFIIFQSHHGEVDETEAEGVVRFSTNKLTFKASSGSLLMDFSPSEVRQLSLEICETADCVPDLLPARSIEESDYSGNQSPKDDDASKDDDAARLPQQPQSCHIVEVDLTMEASKRERTITDDVTIILGIKIRDQNQPNGETDADADDANDADADADGNDADADDKDGGGGEEGDEEEEDDDAKMHLYKIRFPQADLLAVHSYMDLWHADKLKVSDNFQRHLTIESSGILEIDDLVGPNIMDESAILDDRQFREIYRSLPLKIQNQSWCLAYSTRVNGFSLQNLYRTIADESSPFLVIVQDNNGFIFGAYLTCTPSISENFIGTGKSWIFSFGMLELPGSGESGGEAFINNGHHLNVFHWSGRNEYFFRGDPDHMIIGAGDGKFGIFIDGNLHKGCIQECETFEGWPHQEMDFIISCLECWRFA